MPTNSHLTRSGFPGLLLAAFVAVSCSSGKTELAITVVTDGEQVTIMFREPARPDCTCMASNMPEVGECIRSWENFSCTCDPRPASCLELVTLMRGESVMAHYTEFGDNWYGFLSFGASGLADEIHVHGCGGSAVIPLPGADYQYPIATITNTEFISESEFRVEWETHPDTELVFETRRESLSSRRCLAPNDGEATFRYSEIDGYRYGLVPVASTEVSTDIGVATVWAGKPTGAPSP